METLPSMAEITKVVSGRSSAKGCSREVFIFGDLVIKKEVGDWGNLAEIDAYHKFKPGEYTINGETYSIKVPKMAMVGRYLVAERVPFPHLALLGDDYLIAACAHNDNYEECEDCYEIIRAVEDICADEYKIYDMHHENFMWDAATRTAWLVDIAC